MRLFKMVELKDGVLVQFLAVYVLHWQSEWGEPEYGFVEYDLEEDHEPEISQNIMKGAMTK